MEDETDIPEFWERAFKEKKEMWGFGPSNSAIQANEFFLHHSVRSILIPGIGYGRNAQVFKDSGITVTGIEISQTAIDMAKEHFGADITIYHGSVTDMPFDKCKYKGIFCHGLIYLLPFKEREKLIQDCWNQLTENGYMIFTVISKKASTYGQGKLISKDQYEMFSGVSIFFYDQESIEDEFGAFGLFEVTEVTENYPFFLIKCRKGDS
jgi:SAM-dependent methyltransferase